MNVVESRCGIKCSECGYREKMQCAGCLAINNPFWGDCPVKSCCEGRVHSHCGQCRELPCDLLNGFAYDKEQGDGGKRIENCRSWANYEIHGIGMCELTADDVIAALEKEMTLILATCADNRVTIRPMSHVNEGLSVYFQTGEHYLKSQQIKANPHVALSVGTYEIEGHAEIIGHPTDESNRFFMDKYKVKFPNYADYSTLPQQVLIKVEINLVRQWQYKNGKPFIAVKRF